MNNINKDFLNVKKPLRAYFPFFIQKFLPKKIRKYIRRFLTEIDSVETFYDQDMLRFDDSIDGKFLGYAINTHDVDSYDGSEHIQKILKIDEDFGIKSVWFINFQVLEKRQLLAEKILNFGHTIGLHDIIHDFKTPYISDKEMLKRFDSAAVIIEKYKISAYRSAGLYRTEKMYKLLKNRFRVDSSLPSFSFNRRAGCGKITPFYMNNLFEVPLNMPMDSDLIFADASEKDILQIFKNISDFLYEKKALVINTTHTEPHFFGNKRYHGIYAELLEYQLKKNINFIDFENALLLITSKKK